MKTKGYLAAALGVCLIVRRLGHGVLALQIADHTVEETLEHTGLSGGIQHKPNPKAHRQAEQWHKIVKDLRVQGGKLKR